MKTLCLYHLQRHSPTMTEGTAGEFAVFDLPKLQFNEDGWGPTWEIPQNFRDMPYQPFCKSDRMGKISDWTGNALTDKKFPSECPGTRETARPTT